MAFKSLIIFALVASVGRVLSAPLEGRHLGARNPCHRTWCARDIVDVGYPNLVRRFASFDDPGATLSSGIPGTSTAVDPSATVDPTSVPSDCPSSIPSASPPAIPTVSPSPLPTDDTVSGIPTEGFTGGGGLPPSSTSNGTPQATDPAVGDPVTVTVISTVFLTPTNPVVSPPIQPPALSSSSVSQPPVVSPPVSSPAPSLPPAAPSLPPAAPSPSVIELTNTVPGSTVSSNPAGQPTPVPSPGGIIFLPPI